MTEKEKINQLEWLNEGKQSEWGQKLSDNIYENMTNTEQWFIEEKKKELDEAKKKLSQLIEEKTEKEKAIPEMSESFVEDLCLSRLSTILTKKELNLVKKWRERRDLHKIYDSTWSLRDDLANKVLNRLKDLTDYEKLAFGNYLSKKWIIFWWYDYSIWYYYTDGLACDLKEVRSVLNMLWLEKYVKYIWDLCYHIDSSIIEDSNKKLFETTLPADIISINEEIKRIDEEIEKILMEIADLLKKTEAVQLYWLPVNQALSTLNWKKSLDWMTLSEYINKNRKVYVYLNDYSYYPWWGCWMEYWVKLFVKRWNKKDMEKIVYRDAYSASRDDWWKSYRTIDKVEVHDDEVIVTVSSSKRTDTYTFRLEKQEWESDEKILSAQEEKEFRDYVEAEKKRLLEENTRHSWKYPVCYDLNLRQIPGAFGTNGVHPYEEKKYDEAEVIDEYVDVTEWTAYIVIKTQIDANADSGKQFQWLKYEVKVSWTTLLEQDTAYQSQLLAWKEINIQAI